MPITASRSIRPDETSERSGPGPARSVVVERSILDLGQLRVDRICARRPRFERVPLDGILRLLGLGVPIERIDDGIGFLAQNALLDRLDPSVARFRHCGIKNSLVVVRRVLRCDIGVVVALVHQEVFVEGFGGVLLVVAHPLSVA